MFWWWNYGNRGYRRHNCLNINSYDHDSNKFETRGQKLYFIIVIVLYLNTDMCLLFVYTVSHFLPKEIMLWFLALQHKCIRWWQLFPIYSSRKKQETKLAVQKKRRNKTNETNEKICSSKIFRLEHKFLVTTHFTHCSENYLKNFRQYYQPWKQLFMVTKSKKCLFTYKARFHPWPWGFWFILSIGWKHFRFHVLIFLLPGLPSARSVRKTSQHENWKRLLPIGKSYRSSPGMKNTIFYKMKIKENEICFSTFFHIVWRKKNLHHVMEMQRNKPLHRPYVRYQLPLFFLFQMESLQGFHTPFWTFELWRKKCWDPLSQEICRKKWAGEK